MKKLAFLFVAALSFTAAKAQQMSGDNTFVSTLSQKISVNDTVKIGFPTPGQQTYMFIENKADKKIKKTSKIANGVSNASGLLGLGGLKGAVTGIKVSQAASNVGMASGAADIINGNGIIKPDQKLIIIKFYKGEDKEIFAEAVNLSNTKYTIKINSALLVKEIVMKDSNIYQKEADDDKDDKESN